jgi:hypothetical protein
MSSASYVIHGISAPILARAQLEIAKHKKIARRNVKEFIVFLPLVTAGLLLSLPYKLDASSHMNRGHLSQCVYTGFFRKDRRAEGAFPSSHLKPAAIGILRMNVFPGHKQLIARPQ